MLTEDYRFSEYPIDDNGVPLFGRDDWEDDENASPASAGDDFEGYLSWLVDYLATISADLTGDQADYAGCLLTDAPGNAIGRLAFDVAMHELLYEMNVDEFDEDELAESVDFDWPYEVEIPVDIGYRVLIARIIAPVHDRSERLSLLRTYFETYQDEILK